VAVDVTERAVVIAARLNGADVRLLATNETRSALNALNLRCPPRSIVLVTFTGGRYVIVGRER
jgi:hypothetical protein